MKIAYGLDTGSIEDLAQLVLVAVPDEVAEQGGLFVRDHLVGNFADSQVLVGLDDVLDALALALSAEGYSSLTERVSADIVQQLGF